jgi:hypothetical protein
MTTAPIADDRRDDLARMHPGDGGDPPAGRDRRETDPSPDLAPITPPGRGRREIAGGINASPGLRPAGSHAAHPSRCADPRTIDPRGGRVRASNNTS